MADEPFDRDALRRHLRRFAEKWRPVVETLEDFERNYDGLVMASQPEDAGGVQTPQTDAGQQEPWWGEDENPMDDGPMLRRDVENLLREVTRLPSSDVQERIKRYLRQELELMDETRRNYDGIVVDPTRVLRAIEDFCRELSVKRCVDAPEKTVSEESDGKMLNVIAIWAGNVVDEKAQQVLSIARCQDKSVNDRLEAMHETWPIPDAASASTLAKALGVSPSAIKKTSWWQNYRAGKRDQEVHERKTRMRQRAKLIDPDSRPD